MIRMLDILVVEDDEEDFFILKDFFAEIQKFKVRLSYTKEYNEAMNLIDKNQYDVYLIDYRLGIYDGLEVTAEIIAKGITQPVILLTGQSDPKVDEAAAKIGASDYLVKGQFNALILERSIRYGLKQTYNLKEIKSLNEGLEKRVEARTSELIRINQQLKNEIEERKKIERQLRDSEATVKKSLEKEREVGEMKSRFMTIASHEFRTPLSAIFTSAQLLEKYTLTEQQDKREKHIKRIKGAVRHLNAVLDDFLSIAKIEEGKATFQPIMVPINEFCRSILDEMVPVKTESQSLDIVTDFKDEEEFYIDPQILRTVLNNLISNAIKYTGLDGDILLNAVKNETTLEFVVIDNGIGIPKSEQKNIFERFYRATNASNIKGTGIGLNIVKKYVELIKGTIIFESEENKGSKFTITLPLNNGKDITN